MKPPPSESIRRRRRVNCLCAAAFDEQVPHCSDGPGLTLNPPPRRLLQFLNRIHLLLIHPRKPMPAQQPKTITIALVQMRCDPEPEANLQKAISHIRQA